MADEHTAPDLRPDHVRRGDPDRPAPAGGPSASAAGVADAASSATPSAAAVAASASPVRLGRYQLLFELARGGMGAVHVARLVGAHGFDRTFAIKRLLAGDAPRDEVVSFLDEARLSAKIHHPNVVETIDLGEHDGEPYIVMLFVPGVSLARLLGRLREKGEQIDPWLVAWIMREIASGLHAAHELKSEDGELLGLVHRDVSPENVLLSFDGRALLTDFGVAKWRQAERSTKSGVTKGKFAYMSPEQTHARGVDRRTDVFALGVVAHEALAGRRLFAGESPADTIRRVLDSAAPDPRAERPEVPEELAALVLRCLAKDAARRPASADEVAGELRALLRRERRVIDSSDVAALLQGAFPGERERLAERVERAARAADARVEDAFFEGGERPPGSASMPSAESHASVTATAMPVQPPARGRRTLAAVVVIAAVAIAAAVLALRRAPDAPTNAGVGSTSVVSPPLAPSSIEPTAASAVLPAPSSTASAEPSTTASAGPTKKPPRPAITAAPTEPKPAAPASEAPSVTKPPSKKGVPFQSLEP